MRFLLTTARRSNEPSLYLHVNEWPLQNEHCRMVIEHLRVSLDSMAVLRVTLLIQRESA